MTRSRKHHFVQQAHLSLFEDESQLLTVGGKDGSRFRPSTGSIFAERDLYAYETEGVTTSEFEDRLTELESQTFPALHELAHTRVLTASSLPLIRTYLTASYLRNPSHQAGVIAMHQHSVKAALRILEAQGLVSRFPNDGTPFGGRTVSELVDAGLVVVEINNAKFLDAMLHVFDGTLNLVSGFELSLLSSPEGRIAIGDHPLTFMHPTIDFGPYGIPLGGGSCELTFPVSKHLSLVGRWKEALSSSEKTQAVNQVNRRQVLFASKHVAIGAELGEVEKMLGRYAKVSFGTDVQTLPFGDVGAIMPTRRGFLPTSEWRKVRKDFVDLGSTL
jgi:hypothetical protein